MTTHASVTPVIPRPVPGGHQCPGCEMFDTCYPLSEYYFAEGDHLRYVATLSCEECDGVHDVTWTETP